MIRRPSLQVAAHLPHASWEVGLRLTSHMAIDGIGLMGRVAHTVHDAADRRTLGTRARRAAVLIHRPLANR